jgi:hypothetical protein
MTQLFVVNSPPALRATPLEKGGQIASLSEGGGSPQG